MTFNSLTFLVFFALVVALHRMPFAWRTKKLVLLEASYVFYAALNPPFVVLLWLSTIIDWKAAQGLETAESTAKRRGLLFLSLVANLGLLGYFKYGGFLLENFAALAAAAGIATILFGVLLIARPGAGARRSWPRTGATRTDGRPVKR